MAERHRQQHGRHAEGERDLARGGVLGLHEVHVLGRERHRLPVEPAFQHQRPPGIGGALVFALELALETIELLVAERAALGRAIDRAPEGRAALSSSALFQRAAALWVSTAQAAASNGLSP